MRARWEPRQVCTPRPKARWRLASRSNSTGSASSHARSSVWAEPKSAVTIATAGGPSIERTGVVSRRPLYIACGAASRAGSSIAKKDCESLIGIVLSTALIDLEAHGLAPQSRPRDPAARARSPRQRLLGIFRPLAHVDTSRWTNDQKKCHNRIELVFDLSRTTHVSSNMR